MEITNIFYDGLQNINTPIIKNVPVNWEVHKTGVLNIARSLEQNFTVDKDNKNILLLMLLYYTGNPLFVDEMHKFCGVPGSLNKGLLLLGGVGTGKTLLFKIFKLYTAQILRVNSYQLHNALEIIDNVNISGVDELEKFNNNFGKPITCYIDDIAAKGENVKHYGTNHNVIEQLLSLRYNVYSRSQVLTHATTNKYPAELQEIYDKRVIDRLKEMFNFIELKGKSRRV